MTGDASPVVESQREIMDLFKKNMELQERLMAVMQENADLRVQAERNATRIRELERELEGARRDSGAGGALLAKRRGCDTEMETSGQMPLDHVKERLG